MIDYMGLDADSEEAWRSEKWHVWAQSEAGYIPWSNRPAESACYTGRGETYVGNAAVTKRGYACKTGTFCRNPDPLDQQIPYCQQERDNSWVACQVVGCGQQPPKYSGNRGVSVAMTKKWAPDYSDYGRVSPAYFSDPGRNWVHPAFYMSGGKDHFFYGQDTAVDSNMLNMKNYFIAPLDGLYSFNVIADDRIALKTDFNADDGSYVHDAETHYHMSIDSRQERSNESGGKRRSLVKGEKVYLEALATEWTGNDRALVGVVYHGLDENTGVWQDTREKKHFPQDQYAYDIQRLWFDTDGRHESTWITMRVDREDLEAGNGIDTDAGETFDRTQGVQFKIEQCGDNNQCFTTEELDSRSFDGSGLEQNIKVHFTTHTDLFCVFFNFKNYFKLFTSQKY